MRREAEEHSGRWEAEEHEGRREAGAHEGRSEADEHEGRREIDEHGGRRKAEEQEGRREAEDSTKHEHKTDWQAGQDSIVRIHMVPLYKSPCNFYKSQDFHTTIEKENNIKRRISMKNVRDKELERGRRRGK